MSDEYETRKCKNCGIAPSVVDFGCFGDRDDWEITIECEECGQCLTATGKKIQSEFTRACVYAQWNKANENKD
jgi:uncharacterized Zn finger protein